MATTQLMIQLFTEQTYDESVIDVDPIEDEAYLLLDPSKNTVVCEIATEEYGGVLASGYASAFTIGFSPKAFALAAMISAKDGTETVLYAPSHVPSPPVEGIGLAILKVREVGIAIDSKSGVFSVARAIGSHLYVDQIDKRKTNRPQ